MLHPAAPIFSSLGKRQKTQQHAAHSRSTSDGANLLKQSSAVFRKYNRSYLLGSRAASKEASQLTTVTGSQLVEEEKANLTNLSTDLKAADAAKLLPSTALKPDQDTRKWDSVEGLLLFLEQCYLKNTGAPFEDLNSQNAANSLTGIPTIELLQTRPWRMVFFTKQKPHKQERVPVAEDLLVSQADGVRIATQFGTAFSVTFMGPCKWENDGHVLQLEFNKVQIQLLSFKFCIPLPWRPSAEVPRALHFFWLDSTQGFAAARMDSGGLIFFLGV